VKEVHFLDHVGEESKGEPWGNRVMSVKTEVVVA